MPSDYLNQILASQNQRKITGQGALTGPQVEAAFTADLATRYQAEAANRNQALQERQVNIQQQSVDNQAKATNAQINAGSNQTLVSGVTGVAQAYGAYKTSSALGNLLKPTPATGTTPATTTAATGEATGAGVGDIPAAESAAYTGSEAGVDVAAGGAEAGAGAAVAGTAAYTAGASAAGAEAGAGVVAGLEAGTVAAEGAGFWTTVGEGVLAAAAAWVLCSELVRQGKLEQSIVNDEWEYIRKILTVEEYSGYRIISDPLVSLMQKSECFTFVIAPLIRAFAYEMASRVNKEIQGSRWGKFILWAGLPLCRMASRIKMEVDSWHRAHIQ